MSLMVLFLGRALGNARYLSQSIGHFSFPILCELCSLPEGCWALAWSPLVLLRYKTKHVLGCARGGGGKQRLICSTSHAGKEGQEASLSSGGEIMHGSLNHNAKKFIKS